MSCPNYSRKQCKACGRLSIVWYALQDYPGLYLCQKHYNEMRGGNPSGVMEDVRNKAIRLAQRKGAK